MTFCLSNRESNRIRLNEITERASQQLLLLLFVRIQFSLREEKKKNQSRNLGYNYSSKNSALNLKKYRSKNRSANCSTQRGRPAMSPSERGRRIER